MRRTGLQPVQVGQVANLSYDGRAAPDMVEDAASPVGSRAMPRIVSLIASATEIVCALGFEEQLVGRSHECDYPEGVRRLPVCTAPKFDIDGGSRAIDDRV